jgi:DNA-directed RNA polymerase subunit RPC12/RpoP
MTDSGLRERRFRAATTSLTHECRLCWRPVVLEARCIEVTDQHIYVRCPHCSGSFPIRHSDVGALPGHEVPAAS